MHPPRARVLLYRGRIYRRKSERHRVLCSAAEQTRPHQRRKYRPTHPFTKSFVLLRCLVKKRRFNISPAATAHPAPPPHDSCVGSRDIVGAPIPRRQKTTKLHHPFQYIAPGPGAGVLFSRRLEGPRAAMSAVRHGASTWSRGQAFGPPGPTSRCSIADITQALQLRSQPHSCA